MKLLMMMEVGLLLLCLSAVGSQSLSVDVNVQEVINVVDERYVSSTLDQYLLQDKPKWATFDFKSTRVRTLLKGLAPGILRLGGTPADWTVFTKASQDVYDKLQELPPMLSISEEDIDNLVDLARSCGVQLLYDLNLELRYGLDWDPTNAISLMQYAISKGYRDVFNFEMGNEPDLYGDNPRLFGHMKLTGTQIGKDFKKLHIVMEALNFTGFLVGPDTGSVNKDIWKGFIEEAGSILTAVTFHHYYFDGSRASYKDYINPSYFDGLIHSLDAANILVKNSSFPNLQVWIGETSDGLNRGTQNVSDRFVSGFLWLDKLGLAAKHGIKVVMRQDFYAHNYPLIGVDLYPNPDYWLTLLHKRLVGQSVFNVTTSDTLEMVHGKVHRKHHIKHSSPEEVRVYAHCTQSSETYQAGALTVFALSVQVNSSVQLTFQDDLQKLDVDVYLLTPYGPQGILSRNVSLNGHVLSLVDDNTLPKFTPVQQPASQGITLPPLSFGYFVFPKADLAKCKGSKFTNRNTVYKN